MKKGDLIHVTGGRIWFAQIFRNGIVVTQYDGSQTFGRPPDTDAFRKAAADLGYGDDTYQHMIEHDLCHAILAEEIDGAPSAALWNQAHDQKAYLKKMPASVERDEYIVGAAQAALNGLPWGLDRLRECLENDQISARTCLNILHAKVRPNGRPFTRSFAKYAETMRLLPRGWDNY